MKDDSFYTQYKRHIKAGTKHVQEAVELCDAYLGKRFFGKEKQFKYFGHYQKDGMYSTRTPDF